MSRAARLLFTSTLLLAALARPEPRLNAAQQPADVNPAPELAIKAAVVANFPKFVDWPASAFESRTAPFVIAILGDDRLAPAVASVFRDKRIADRPVAIVHVSRIEDLQACHVLYVSASEERRLEQVLESMNHRAVLTIGDFGSFAQRGGMIGLVLQNDRVRFDINERAARASGLRLSANLLRLATAVVS